MTDQQYMQLAIQLAKKGAGKVKTNPLVGAVIVKNGRLIGQGYHACYGAAHAEPNALASLTEPADGATLYVTLEPCCHYGKTPPCTQAIINSGIKTVVVGTKDPNPLVNGKGLQCLREHGINVMEGLEAEACQKLNEAFFHFMQTKTPFVTMKYAMTMDGKIATKSGHSKWISGDIARTQVHSLRNQYAAIMVGIGTILGDDPQLTCRLPEGKNPIRIICDSRLRTPHSANVIQTAASVPTIIATCCEEKALHAPYQEAGCSIMVMPTIHDQINLKALMQELGRQNIDSVLLEGGGTLNWSALASGIVNKVVAYISPKLFGGAQAIGPVTGLGVDRTEQAFSLSSPTITKIGDDILLESEVLPCSPES